MQAAAPPLAMPAPVSSIRRARPTPPMQWPIPHSATTTRCLGARPDVHIRGRIHQSTATSRKIGGTPGSQDDKDLATKFVSVTVSPVAVPTIFPCILQSGGHGTVFRGRAGSRFTAATACQVRSSCTTPETSGMTDTAATQALIALSTPTTPSFDSVRRQIRWLLPGFSREWMVQTQMAATAPVHAHRMAAVSGAAHLDHRQATGNANSAENIYDSGSISTHAKAPMRTSRLRTPRPSTCGRVFCPAIMETGAPPIRQIP